MLLCDKNDSVESDQVGDADIREMAGGIFEGKMARFIVHSVVKIMNREVGQN